MSDFPSPVKKLTSQNGEMNNASSTRSDVSKKGKQPSSFWTVRKLEVIQGERGQYRKKGERGLFELREFTFNFMKQPFNLPGAIIL